MNDWRKGKDRDDLWELVRKANEHFASLPPEKQRAMREAQRRSWVVGEMMLEHDDMSRETAEELYDRMER